MIRGLVSCTKQNEEFYEKQVVSTCDTVNTKFALNVFPIFQANCFSCHANGESQGGISLDTYSKIKFHATSGDLLQVINHVPGFPQMPLNTPKLSKCEIDKITAWVFEGAPNN